MDALLRREAEALDEEDSLKHLRNHFVLPPQKVYFCGNSLGPLPRSLLTVMPKELEKWATQGVEGHFLEPNPWVTINETCVDSMARIVGGHPTEVVLMNSLTVNIHLLLVSFYQPTSQRFKIVIESSCFPSDLYAVMSHIKFRGLDPSHVLVRCDSTEQVYEAVTTRADVQLCFLGGVHYQTGEVVDMAKLARVCQQHNVCLGLDLAHAVGNVKLDLHAWGVDFATWCTYKYLNSGPGGIAGVFVHEKRFHVEQRLEGWWGNAKASRFEMKREFQAEYGASAWQLSNPPVLPLVSLRCALDVFDLVPELQALYDKSSRLTGFLVRALTEVVPEVKILTPERSRGCQVSLVLLHQQSAKLVCERLSEKHFICDFREPNILRIAPNPMYNTFAEVVAFVQALQSVCRRHANI